MLESRAYDYDIIIMSMSWKSQQDCATSGNVRLHPRLQVPMPQHVLLLLDDDEKEQDLTLSLSCQFSMLQNYVLHLFGTQPQLHMLDLQKHIHWLDSCKYHLEKSPVLDMHYCAVHRAKRNKHFKASGSPTLGGTQDLSCLPCSQHSGRNLEQGMDKGVACRFTQYELSDRALAWPRNINACHYSSWVQNVGICALQQERLMSWPT